MIEYLFKEVEKYKIKIFAGIASLALLGAGFRLYKINKDLQLSEEAIKLLIANGTVGKQIVVIDDDVLNNMNQNKLNNYRNIDGSTLVNVLDDNNIISCSIDDKEIIKFDSMDGNPDNDLTFEDVSNNYELDLNEQDNLVLKKVKK